MKDGRDQFREAISAILRDDQEKIFAGKFQEYKQLLKAENLKSNYGNTTRTPCFIIRI